MCWQATLFTMSIERQKNRNQLSLTYSIIIENMFFICCIFMTNTQFEFLMLRLVGEDVEGTLCKPASNNCCTLIDTIENI